jgi:putative DNA primase/helicase
MWSGEDDSADVLTPRLIASGADMSRVHFVQGVRGSDASRSFDPATDADALAAALAGISDVRLLIVDPISSAVAGDSHKNTEVRRGLQPLVDLATKHRCALLGITHLSKGTAGRDPVERVTGSLAFGALARVVMLAAKQEAEGDRPARRVLMRAKSNIGPDTGGYAYELRQDELPAHPGVFASSVQWGAPVNGTARELLAEAEQDTEPETANDAADFLRGLLADGPRAAKGIYHDADGAGFTKSAMYRARRRLGIVTAKQGMSGGWVWRLPVVEDSTEDSEGLTLPRLHSSESSALPSGNGADL